RQGPRPLPFHLLTQATSLLSSLSALPLWKSGSASWNKPWSAEESELRAAINRVDPAKLNQALSDETIRRVDDFLAGIKAYRDHPYRRTLEPMPVVWRQGSTRLFDYAAPDTRGTPVLVVPSLVNRSYVLDLTPKRSLMRHLAKKGLRPFLIDWGSPGEEERRFGLDDYIGTRLSAALDEVTARAGKPALLGYCMGGLLTLGLAALRPNDVLGQVLMAVPWDFHRPTSLAAQPLTALREPIEHAIERLGELPGDMLQILFALPDACAVERKFRQFARLNQTQAAARRFVALEDWVNDCVPLTAAVARETFFGWYGDNLPGRNQWRVAGVEVVPRRLRHPALVVVPARDRIVPAESARPLADALPNGKRLIIGGGHVGMLIGARAVTELYAPIAAFLGRMRKHD
ncbi:MAG TPA: alpha/beta fold hydrolase, partial [Dongiaceae bacterium]